MFSLFNKKQPQEKRANPLAPILFFENEKFSNSQKLQEFIKEGYQSNVIAYRCISEIATAIASIEIEIWSKNKFQENHPLYSLLKRPNPLQSGKKFIREMVTNLKVTGNSYIAGYNSEQFAPDKPMIEVYNIPTENIQIEVSKKGFPAFYIARGKLGEAKFSVNQLNGFSQLLHISEVSIDNNLVGMSAFAPSAISCDLHNSALRWNFGLLKNGAKPPFAITPKGDTGFTTEQKAQIKEWFNREYQGENNAGKPLTIAGVEITEMGFSPSDMDYSSVVSVAANNIALAFGVPPVLITGEGNTFNNVREAREAFYENTILPLLDEILAELSNWFKIGYKDETLQLKYNPDNISALESKRERKFARMKDAVEAGILTKDEARIELGYNEYGGLASELFVSTSQIPISDAGIEEPKLEQDEISN